MKRLDLRLLAKIWSVCIATAAIEQGALAEPPRRFGGLVGPPGQTELEPALLRVPGDSPTDSGGVDAPLVPVPALERFPTDLMTPVPAWDHPPAVAVLPDGQLAVATLERFRARVLYSPDEGSTFTSEVDLPTGDGSPDARGFGGDNTPGGRIYAAVPVADAAGRPGLRFTRSDDMGRTWSAALTLVGTGSPLLGVGDDLNPVVSAGPGDRVAVLFKGAFTNPHVMTSDDGGSTWTAAVRIDSGASAGAAEVLGYDLDIDGSGRIHAAFAENRGSGIQFFCTSSTDGGQTFSPEVLLGPAVPNASGVGNGPDVEIAPDGALLVAFRYGISNSGVKTHFVKRSTDGGAVFTDTMSLSSVGENGNDFILGPQLRASRSNDVVLYAYQVGANVRTIASSDAGASFAAVAVDASAGRMPAAVNNPFGQHARFHLAETASGTWVIAWNENVAGDYVSMLQDIWSARSTDGGATWGATSRADSGVAGTARSLLGEVAPVGADDVLVVFADFRDDGGRGSNLYRSRAPAATLAFGTDGRIDTDASTVAPNAWPDASMASDGSNHVYVAFAARGDGLYTDIYVAASADRGLTFGAPIRIPSVAAGSAVRLSPRVAATGDGRVHVAFLHDPPSGTREVRVNTSTDFGATWQATDRVVGTAGGGRGDNYYTAHSLQIATGATSNVYVAWGDLSSVRFARSTDGGSAFSTSIDADGDSRNYAESPRMCAQGNQVVLVFADPNVAFNFYSVWARVSTNAGLIFGSRVQLRPEGIGNDAYYPVVVCDGTNRAFAAFTDWRAGLGQIRVNRFNGTSWQGDIGIGAPGGTDALQAGVAYAGSNVVAVGFEDLATGGVHQARSIDSGATWSTASRLDGQPAVGYTTWRPVPLVASDGAGRVWISWMDSTQGVLPSIASPTRETVRRASRRRGGSTDANPPETTGTVTTGRRARRSRVGPTCRPGSRSARATRTHSS